MQFFASQSAYSFVATEPKIQVLPEGVSVLRDASATYGLSDIRNPDIAKEFQKLSAESGQTDFGFTKDAIWIKVPMQRLPESAKTWILEVPYLGLDSVTLYNPEGSALSVGGLQPANKRTIFQRFDAFPIELSTQSEDFYLRVQSQYAVSIPLILWQVPAYTEAKLKDNLTQALYYGGALALIIYNFLLFISIRDRGYLLYALFASAIAMGMFAGNGYGYLLFWPNSPNWNAIAQSFFVCWGACFSLIFTQSYLKTKLTLPKSHKGLSLIASSFVVIAMLFPIAGVIGINNALLFRALMLITPVSALLIFYVCIKKVLLADHSAKYLLIAFGSIWLGAAIAALRALNVLPTNGFTAYALQIGSAFEMLLLSFALANRINTERNLRKEAEALHNQYIRFSSLVSHEFRTPLNVIESQAALLEREHTNGLDNLTTRTHVIMSAVQHLSHLFTKWTQADRLQNAMSQSNPVSVDLYVWLGNVIDRCREFYSTHCIELEIDPDTQTIWADKELLQIALMNLIDNASKYSPTGSVIQVGTILREGMTGIFVIDTGVGIPAEHQAAIFNEYIRLDDAANARGVGLGLAFVQKIMDLHAGRIELSSELGVGSTFTLWFPNKPEA